MEEKEKKGRKNFLATAIAFKYLFTILIIVAMVGVFFLGVKMSVKFTSFEKTTKLGLENVGELVTQTCYTTVLEDSKVNLEFFKLFDIPFTESRQIFSYDFEVDASVDFEKIEISKIDDKNKEIIVKIPHARVYKTTLNPSSFKVYLDSDGLLTRIDLEKHNTAIKNMQEQAEADCVANNLLSSADQNASRLMKSIVKSNAKYKDYKVSETYID